MNEKQEFKEAQLTIPVIQSMPFLTLKIATVKYLCIKNSGIIRWVSLNRLALLKSKKNKMQINNNFTQQLIPAFGKRALYSLDRQ